MFTSEVIQNDPAVKEILGNLFEKIISAKDIGFDKGDKNVYLYISKELGVMPEEILFVDDWENNIVTAKSAGLNVSLYKDNNGLINYLNMLH